VDERERLFGCDGGLTAEAGEVLELTSARHAQRFLSAFSGTSPHVRPGRHRLSAQEHRHAMTDRFTTWNQVTGAATAA
jgi:hypothetical protein